MSSEFALPALRSGSAVWKAPLRQRAEALGRDLDGVGAEAFLAALRGEAARRIEAFLSGITAYRSHPYHRDLPDAPIVASEGETRLLSYALPGARGPAVLVVPSLINRAYILDLSPERSFMRHLADEGMRPYLVDWGAPGRQEAGFSLEDYVAGRLGRLLDGLSAHGIRPVLAGYCMGGLLALALAEFRPDQIRGLILLATPWDFHAPAATPGALLAGLRPWLDDVIQGNGGLPVDILQMLFSTIDPGGVERKFRRFAAMPMDSRSARDFVALEDWLNDGVALAGPVARECLFGWYGENRPAKGEWKMAGRIIAPEHVLHPALCLVPAGDRIVPPASALPLGERLPRCVRHTVDGGHIGMIVGRRAKATSYRIVANWLKNIKE